MRTLFIFFIVITSIVPIPAQLPWHRLGSYDYLVYDTTGLHTPGYVQPNQWIRPWMRDSVVSDDDAVIFEQHDPLSPIAPYYFDTPVADTTGWYRYTVFEPYRNRQWTDSVFVRFQEHDDGNDEDGPSPDPGSPKDPMVVKPARIVNLVIVDNYDYTRFRILNMEDYNRVELILFDVRGRAIYRTSDYMNDYDFRNMADGTYYYQVTLHNSGMTTTQKGFVEVLHR